MRHEPDQIDQMNEDELRDELRKAVTEIIRRRAVPVSEPTTELIHAIKQWSEAYPLEAFPELTSEDWGKVREVLKTHGPTSLDCVSASNMRHVIARLMEHVRRIDNTPPT